MDIQGERRLLARLIWLSVAAAVATVTLKTVAWRLTGSVGLFSDALESLVNLAGALIALAAIRWATRPPDREHMYGHEKAEYFSAGVEGTLIVLAAVAIVVFAIDRLLHPAELVEVGVGLAVSAAASAINLAVGLVLIRFGTRLRSIALEADGRHLLTDVWTSVGVIVGVAAVAVTGWKPLDPIVALAVAVNIVFVGVRLVQRSIGGLMDRALPDEQRAAVEAALAAFRDEGIVFHALRTRRSGRRSFVSMHVLVPGSWTVQRGHELLERVETTVRDTIPDAAVFTHLEPVEDPASLADAELDRTGPT